ncbi:hypothetical protein RHMOL_Rhmol03G0271400 [Rhododendron molle]|uniref:Uncharacterized protein n=1 Tax=Rhododendron molle TaxID=49168 RepID=A0ACC0PM45_RHOML|nr:hypothetical protein RHMOL_Rhmol03G0271400 [Rhododendron molle]
MIGRCLRTVGRRASCRNCKSRSSSRWDRGRTADRRRFRPPQPCSSFKYSISISFNFFSTAPMLPHCSHTQRSI